MSNQPVNTRGDLDPDGPPLPSPPRRWEVGPHAESAARPLEPGDELIVVNAAGGVVTVRVTPGYPAADCGGIAAHYACRNVVENPRDDIGQLLADARGWSGTLHPEGIRAMPADLSPMRLVGEARVDLADVLDRLAARVDDLIGRLQSQALADALESAERARSEAVEMRAERDALLGLIVCPMPPDAAGRERWGAIHRTSLRPDDRDVTGGAFRSRGEAEAFVRRAAGLDAGDPAATTEGDTP